MIKSGVTHCHQGDTPVSQLGDELVSIPVLVVDASAHFDSERAVQYLNHSSDNSLKPSVPPHQGRARSLQCHNIPMNKTFFSNFKTFDLQATISRLSGLCFYYNGYQSRQWGNSYSILPKIGYIYPDFA